MIRELQFELFEQLGLSDAVKRKIYRDNAAKIQV
jgi:predicted TIM-barrel fold metal-dependent hydrolase